MSFTRLDFDPGTYATELKQSVRVGEYMVQQPAIACEPCFQADPWMRLGTMGDSTVAREELIGVDSELLGLTRRASRCPAAQYGGPNTPAPRLHAPVRCDARSTEDTRLSNPPCNMRGGENGFNRFEFLRCDPQATALMSFPTMVNNSLIVKDNHRPCVPKPITPEGVLPRFDAPRGAVPAVRSYGKHAHAASPLLGPGGGAADALPAVWNKCAEVPR